MPRPRGTVVLLALAGCTIDPSGISSHGDAKPALVDARPPDATVDAADRCSTGVELGPFGAATPVTELNTAAWNDANPTLTGDMRLIDFVSVRADGVTSVVYEATRAAATDPWGAPVPQSTLVGFAPATTPELTPDGLALFFDSGLTGSWDIWETVRAKSTDAWGTPALVTELNTAKNELSATPTPDLLTLVLTSDRLGTGWDLFASARGSASATWSTPVLIGELSPSTTNDLQPWVDDSGCVIFFASDRTGNYDLFVATRARPSVPFSTPTPVSELNTGAHESGPWLSPDLRTIYFTSTRGPGGDWDLYTASR